MYQQIFDASRDAVCHTRLSKIVPSSQPKDRVTQVRTHILRNTVMKDRMKNADGTTIAASAYEW